MKIFFLLNGMGVIFLLYVLAMFWIEGQRSKRDARRHASEDGGRDWTDVLVVTHPISHYAQGGLAVIPFPATDRPSEKPARKTSLEAPVRRFSTR